MSSLLFPPPSALDIQDFTLPSLSASYINGVASGSFSRTDGFLAQEQFTPVSSGSSPFNQAHVSFTPRNTEWMYNEMQRPFFVPTPTNPTANPLACDATECDPAANKTITGPLTLCTGSSGPATYT